jgi:hypothetical protein
VNLLIRLWFDGGTQNCVSAFAMQHGKSGYLTKDFTGELFIPD